MREREARSALVDVARELDRDGLNHAATGNLSVRIEDLVLVTPSGIAARDLRPEDCVAIGHDGSPRDGSGLLPTSEWRLHVELYRRAGIDAVVHTHSPEATAAAVLGRPVPAVHYVVAKFGGTLLPSAPYATYGTQELAESVASTLGDRYAACLMANHGAIAVAGDLPTAATLARDIEWLCGVWRRARQLGDPVVLDDAEVERVSRRLATYGQPD
jgi:L-fuculose-phosphate aldolase